MKKIIFTFLVVFSLHTFAQNEFTEGIIIQQQKMTSTNEQMNAHLSSMGDMKTTTYIKGNKSRSELSNPMSGESVSIVDNDKKEIFFMINNPMLGKKYLIKSIDLSEEEKGNYVVTKTDDTKTVLGYKCEKYNVSVTKDGVETKMAVYTTDKIKAPSQQSAMFSDKISGFPLFIEIYANQMGMEMTITIEVTEIKEETVSDDKFDMTAPDGYEKVDKIPGM